MLNLCEVPNPLPEKPEKDPVSSGFIQLVPSDLAMNELSEGGEASWDSSMDARTDAKSLGLVVVAAPTVVSPSPVLLTMLLLDGPQDCCWRVGKSSKRSKKPSLSINYYEHKYIFDGIKLLLFTGFCYYKAQQSQSKTLPFIFYPPNSQTIPHGLFPLISV
jgi:hypothetical protein